LKINSTGVLSPVGIQGVDEEKTGSTRGFFRRDLQLRIGPLRANPAFSETLEDGLKKLLAALKEPMLVGG
jgi:hypothetical protein